MYRLDRTLALLVIVSLCFVPFSAAQNLFENQVSAQEVETDSMLTDDPREKTYILNDEDVVTTDFNASSSDSRIFSQEQGSRTSYTFFDNSTGDMTPVDRVYINEDEGGETERAYIVQVKDENLPDFNQLVGVTGVEKTGSFSLEGMKGFSLIASEEEIQTLEDSNDVNVYRDELVKTSLDESVPQIGGDKLKDWGLNGSQIDLGVIDTGVDYTHPSLGGCTSTEFSNGNCEKVEGGYDFYSDDTDPMDENGHGTHVASTIASTNDTYEGVAPAADIYGYRVLGPEGYGTSSDIIDAIERSVDPNGDGNTSDHLDIISLSLGGPGAANSAKAKAINSAVSSGVLAVVAAGNDGSSYRTVGSPGNAKDALSVGAVDGNDDIAYFSSRGPVYYSNGSVAGIKPDLVAPGVGIKAAWIDGGWNSIQGTSMATPHVSGAAALLMQDRDLTVNETTSVLKTTSNSIGEDVFTQGAGRINLTEAVNASVSFKKSSLFMGEVDSTSFSKTFNVSLLPGDDSATVTFYVEDPDNLESSGGCSPTFSFSANDTTISSEAGKDITMDVTNAGSCSGILEGTVTAVVNSDGNQIEHRLPYSFVKRNYLTVNVHDSTGTDTSAEVYINNAANGDEVEQVELSGGSTQIALPQDNYVVSALKLGTDEKFVLQEEVDTSSVNSVTLDASTATAVNYPGTWNGNTLWHRSMEIGFMSQESWDAGVVGNIDMEALGDQTVHVSKVADDADVDWDVTISGLALKQENSICSNGCGEAADVHKEVAKDIYATAATFDTQSDIGDVSFSETRTTPVSVAYPGNLTDKTEYDRTVSWQTSGSYLGPFLGTDTAVPTSITTHELEAAQADYELDVDVGPFSWGQTLPPENTGSQSSLGELPVLPGKAQITAYNDIRIENLLRGPNGNTEFEGEGRPTLRIYENGSKTLDQRDSFYWYGITRNLKDNTDYRIELEMSMIEDMPAWSRIETHYDITKGSDRVPPYFSDINMPVKFSGNSVDFDITGGDNNPGTNLAVYYRYRSSGNKSSWRLANEVEDNFQLQGSIPKNGYEKVDVKMVVEDDSGNSHTMIVEDAVVEPKNVGFELKGPEDAGSGTDAVYQGICQVRDSNCQGLKVFKDGNTDQPRRVLSTQDANEGYGIAGTFEETVTLPNSGDNYTYTFSFPGMNAYESIPSGEVSKTTDLITANSDSVVISGTDKSYSSIQKAVNNANSGDTIIVKDTYTGIKDTLPLTIDKAVTIKGQGDVTISGRAQHLVMDVNAEPVTIKNLEIVGAAAGVLYTQDSTDDTPLTVKDVTFRNLGSSQYGGAVLTTPGVEAVVKDSRFYNNSYGVYSTPDTSDFQQFTASSAIDARETVNAVESVGERIETIREKASQYSSPSELREAIGTEEAPSITATDSYQVKVMDSEFRDNYIGISVMQTDIRVENMSSYSNNFATSARQYSDMKLTDSDIERNRAALIADSSHVNVSMTDIAGNSYYGVGLVSSTGNLEDNWWGSGAGPTPFVKNLYDGQVSEYERGDILIRDSYSGALPMARPWLLGSQKTSETMDQTMAMQPGWNLISTPRRLYESEWGELKQYGNGMNSSIAYRYDVENENWEQLEDSHNLKPLEAYYIKASETDGIGFKWQSKRGNTAVRPAVRELDQGWNLVGLAVNAGIDRPKSTYMASEYFLNSVSGITKEDTGYSTVISPSGNEADWSVFTSNLDNSETYGMYPYEGYWVFMENDDTLAGMNTEEELG